MTGSGTLRAKLINGAPLDQADRASLKAIIEEYERLMYEPKKGPSIAGLHEAHVAINGEVLDFAQAMSLRVAVSSFRISLTDPDLGKALGPIAEGYDRGLRDVEEMIFKAWR